MAFNTPPTAIEMQRQAAIDHPIRNCPVCSSETKLVSFMDADRWCCTNHVCTWQEGDDDQPPANIVESIGKWGTVASEATAERLSFPHEGDVIDFGEYAGTYPFTSGRYGRVSDEPGSRFALDDEVHVCCQPGSAHLFENGQVDISGGPFTCLKLSGLKFRGEFRVGNFWNWGNNRPGANMGVHYTITRPVFVLEQWKEEDH